MSLYRKPKEPAVVGDLRDKSWQTLPGMDVAPDDPVWAARCEQYWTLQSRLYGWKLSGYALSYDPEGFVSTYTTIAEILPGERTDEHWRVPVESAQVAPLVLQ